MGAMKQFNCAVDEDDYMEVDTYDNLIFFQIFNYDHENEWSECTVGITREKARELISFLESELNI